MSRFRERAELIFKLGQSYGRLLLLDAQERALIAERAADEAYDEGYTDGARDQGEVWVEIDLDVVEDDDSDASQPGAGRNGQPN